MKKSKSSSSGDRLSELPDSLIFHIFWFLPIRDVISTTKLSQRWRNLWTTAPFLNFSHYTHRGSDSLDRARDFFNRALLLWRGVKLLKFKVMFDLELTEALLGDINVWVRFAKEKEVEELYLDVWYNDDDDDDDDDDRFDSLYSCSSLEVLSIKDFSFSIGRNGNVKWDRLKSLMIDSDGWVWDQDAITKVLCGSPKLEVFVLAHLERGHNCCIQSTSLKKLSIEKHKDFESDEYSKNTELKIQTPNLETLQISGVPYSQLLVDHVQSLTDVTLGFCCLELCNHDEFLVLEKPMKQILPTIQHVQSLTLSECCLEVLGVMNKKCLLSPFSKVKFLKFKDSKDVKSFSKHEQIVGLLQIFPNLKRLAIEDDYNDVELSQDENEDGYQDDRLSLDFKANLPNSFLLQLGRVEVTWGASEKSIFLFIQSLLKYASKLEKMVFRVKRCSRPSYPLLFAASQKLLRMPRSSPTAQLIFSKY